MQTLRTTSSFVSTLVLTLVLGACGGGADNPDNPPLVNGDDGVPGAMGVNALISVNAETPGTNCANGGNKIEAGLDADTNGTLAAGEVSSTQYVCNGAAGAAGTSGAPGAAGAPGSSGLSTLVQMRDEPSGTRCAAGGKAIDAGIDSNTNGVLEASEVSSTGYVCNGANGANGANGSSGANSTNGTNGTNGLNTLVSIASEPAGANCTYGGNKVSMGLDSNTNSVLDAGEVNATSYVCNGAPDPMLNWVHVTGTAVQAQSNTGYVAGNDTAQVVVTLPPNPVVGDVVRINGAGVGGWKVAQNAGQSVYTNNLGGMAGATWTAHESNREWQSIASSADGRKLVAVADVFEQIYTSTDGGLNWTGHGPFRNWRTVASSEGGNTLVAAGGSQLHISTDGGVNWTVRGPTANWSSVASSIDGSKLVAATFTDQIYTSSDSGVNWTARDSARNWQSVASSADGSKLVAVVFGGQIYTSTDSGVSWTARESARNWRSVASSADGTKLVAAVLGGLIYTSTDSGVNWTARESIRDWFAVTSSADGNRLVAVANADQIYTSTDGGVSWTPRDSARLWRAVASSADGSRLAAAVFRGQIYTSVASTTPGVTGSISGIQFDAIALQYVGGGMFNVLDHAGSLTAE